MTKAQADRLIRWIPANFNEAVLFSYDQARPWDAFGKMLCGNLGKKGAGLKGIDAAASPATQLARWRRLAWTGGGSVAMGTVYAELAPDSVARGEALERQAQVLDVVQQRRRGPPVVRLRCRS